MSALEDRVAGSTKIMNGNGNGVTAVVGAGGGGGGLVTHHLVAVAGGGGLSSSGGPGPDSPLLQDSKDK